MYYDRVYYVLGILMISGAVIIRTHDGSRVLDLVHRIIIYQLWKDHQRAKKRKYWTQLPRQRYLRICIR